MAVTSAPSAEPYPPGGLAAVTYPAGDATVVAVSGVLQAATFASLDRPVTEALDRGNRHLVLDLHDLRDLDPEALGLLWAALRGVRRRGGTLAVARARSSLYPALMALNSGGLALYGTVSAALAASRDPLAASRHPGERA